MQNEHEGVGHGHPMIHVTDLNTNRTAKFHADWGDKLEQIWTQAYFELGEARRPNDQLECADGTALAPYLSLTLRRFHDKHICHGNHFQIRGETGGAGWLK
jgi:hypothetical protein